MKRSTISPPIVMLTVANLVPLAGVIFIGWDAAFIVLLYWSENLVLGLYNILKIAILRVEHPLGHLGKLLAIPFFSLHFGGFCAVHGFFLLVLFKIGGDQGDFFPKESWPGHLIFLQMLVSVIKTLWQNSPPGMEWPVLGLLISHGISFISNYLGKGEYTRLTIGKLMNQPYKRIVLLHITIIAGGIPIMILGSPTPLLCILVILKVGMDIFFHIREHAPQLEGKIGKEFRSELAG